MRIFMDPIVAQPRRTRRMTVPLAVPTLRLPFTDTAVGDREGCG